MHTPDPKPAPQFTDALHATTRVWLGFTDRLRVLLTGQLEVAVRVPTENEVGAQGKPESWVYVPRLLARFRRREVWTAPPAGTSVPHGPTG